MILNIFMIYEKYKNARNKTVFIYSHTYFHTGMQSKEYRKKYTRVIITAISRNQNCTSIFSSSFCLSITIFVKTICMWSFFALRRKYDPLSVGPIAHWFSTWLNIRITKGALRKNIYILTCFLRNSYSGLGWFQCINRVRTTPLYLQFSAISFVEFCWRKKKKVLQADSLLVWA